MKLAVTQVGRYKIVKLSGKIDWEHARALDKEVQKIVDAGYYHIVFNLDEISFLCSGAIGALVYNLNKVKRNGGAIYIISVNDYVNYIFETLKFDVVFDGLLFKNYEQFQERVLDRS